MAELKPCPFCGRIPMVEDCGDNRYFVRCKCGIAQDKLYGQRCDAVRRWNTRKPSAQKKGHWIDASTTREQKWKCSECGEETTSSAMGLPRYRFCPMCGAYMISHNGNSEEYWMRCNKAWMPLPEPYRKEGDEG